MLGSSIVNRSVRTRPSRRMVSRPSAGEKGAWTRISAVSPGRYSSWSGMRVTSSSSTRLAVGRWPPLTQRVICVSLRRSLSSAIEAVMRYVPPSGVSNVQRTGSSAEVTVQICSSTSTSTHSPRWYPL